VHFLLTSDVIRTRRAKSPRKRHRWTGPVHAKWQRYGTIAVLTGDLGDTVAGAALFVPLPSQVPACGTPLDVAIVGAGAFA